MGLRRVVMVAMPCAEVVEIGGVLDIFYVVNERVAQAGAADQGYAVEVVSPVPTVCAWPGLHLAADRSYRSVRGPWIRSSSPAWIGRTMPVVIPS